jgi:carbon storage regulator CsrA
MLVLTRKENETIWIEPGHIKVTIVGVREDGTVRLGIQAPDNFTILREELIGRYEHMKHQAQRKALKEARDAQRSE